MMLRASVEHAGQSFGMESLSGRDEAQGNVPHQQALLALAEAVTFRDAEAAAKLRSHLIEVLGLDGYIDACAVAAGFQGFSRVADCAGVSVAEHNLRAGGAELQAEIGVTEFFAFREA